MIIKEILYPRRCPVCDRPAPIGLKICNECKGAFVILKDPFCLKCGKKLDSPVEEFCFDCKRKKHLYTKGRALYEYNSVNQSIYRYKYNKRAEYGEYFGIEMAKVLGKEILSWKPDMIIPVPLHSSKYRKRGYNQSAILAKTMANELNIPYSENIISRIKKTTPMKELDACGRQLNLKSAFFVSNNDVKLKTIVIVDDIYTTGSTIDSMTRELLKSGAGKVYYVALSIGTGL